MYSNYLDKPEGKDLQKRVNLEPGVPEYSSRLRPLITILVKRAISASQLKTFLQLLFAAVLDTSGDVDIEII